MQCVYFGTDTNLGHRLGFDSVPDVVGCGLLTGPRGPENETGELKGAC